MIMAQQSIIDIAALTKEISAVKQELLTDKPREEKFQRLHALLTKLVSCNDTVNDLLIKWDEQVKEETKASNKIPVPILDYLDDAILNEKISTPKDIIELFEHGELKGIVTDKDEVDRDVFAAFQAKTTKAKKVKKAPKAKKGEAEQAPVVPTVTTVIEEDLF